LQEGDSVLRSALILSLLFFLLCSCGKKTSEEVAEAIDLALTYLSDDECDKAIDVLEEAGRDSSNAIYLQVLASAYSCRAGYSEITFLTSEITKIDTDFADLMKSLTKLTWSPEIVADSAEYKDLRESLDILLIVDGQAAREAKYGPRKAGDMGVQALLLSLTQLGKFLHFYGNVDADGDKGDGAASVDEQTATPSKCFMTYSDVRASTLLFGLGGICTGTNGHPNMSFAAPDLTTTKRRLCEGLMIVTNIIDILNNLTLPDSIGNLSAAAATVNAFKTTVTTADATLGTLINTTSQSTCETLVAAADDVEFENLQYIYALLFEAGLP
jgi:hypothetical protein